jgi:CrcB protein
LGGVLGVNARYWLGLWVNRWASQQFPWATVLINVTGSFGIGLLTMLLARWLPHQNFRLLIVTGFLGGYRGSGPKSAKTYGSVLGAMSRDRPA